MPMPKPMLYDQVRNPWSKRDGVVVFDIETDYGSDFSFDGKRNREFKCAVAFSYNDGKYYTFTNPEELVALLRTAQVLVTYNGEGFDYIVLDKYGLSAVLHIKDRWVPQGIESYDIMHTIQEMRPPENIEKKYPSLDEMIASHYECHKTIHDPNNPEDLLKHCIEDVKFTKMLYEEETWIVPVKERITERRWSTDYDDDIFGVVWDGENYTRIVDFGIPTACVYSSDDIFTGNCSSTTTCPLCGKGELEMYAVLRCRDDEVECPQCHGITGFVVGSGEIMYSKTKEQIIKDVCSHCGKSLISKGYEHCGYGAGVGYLSSGRSLCRACGKGCYEWERDDTPGFRDRFVGRCCHCGE
jgi:Mor family transcriptional regulator